jgi:hypothetical protein
VRNVVLTHADRMRTACAVVNPVSRFCWSVIVGVACSHNASDFSAARTVAAEPVRRASRLTPTLRDRLTPERHRRSGVAWHARPEVASSVAVSTAGGAQAYASSPDGVTAESRDERERHFKGARPDRPRRVIPCAGIAAWRAASVYHSAGNRAYSCGHDPVADCRGGSAAFLKPCMYHSLSRRGVSPERTRSSTRCPHRPRW